MNSPITKNNIEQFAHTNISQIQNVPKGIVIEFHGLGDCIGMIKETLKLDTFFAEKDIVYVIPYYGPWAWMSDKAVKYVDEVIDCIFDKFDIHDDIPIVSTGLSMGGLGALIYPVYAKRKPVACAAICPVCDLPYHFTERDDTPRTVYNAFSHYNMSLDDAMKTASPIHQIDNMPKIPYYIVCTSKDVEVNQKKHSEVLVPMLEDKGYNVKYTLIPDRGHCDLSNEEAEKYKAFIVSNI